MNPGRSVLARSHSSTGSESESVAPFDPSSGNLELHVHRDVSVEQTYKPPVESHRVRSGRFYRVSTSRMQLRRPAEAGTTTTVSFDPDMSTSTTFAPMRMPAATAYHEHPAVTRFALWRCVRPSFFDQQLWVTTLPYDTPAAERLADRQEVPVSRFVHRWTYSRELEDGKSPVL